MPTPFTRSLSFRAIFKTMLRRCSVDVDLMQPNSTPAKAVPSRPPAPAAKPDHRQFHAEHRLSLPDPCQLLTKAEAESILGDAIRNPSRQSRRQPDLRLQKITATVHGGVCPIRSTSPSVPRITEGLGRRRHCTKQSDAKEMHPLKRHRQRCHLLDDLDILTMQRDITVNVMKDIDSPITPKSIHDAQLVVAQKVFAANPIAESVRRAMLAFLPSHFTISSAIDRAGTRRLGAILLDLLNGLPVHTRSFSIGFELLRSTACRIKAGI